jgi:hypothetical protein
MRKTASWLLGILLIAGGIAACDGTSTEPVRPDGPSMDCGPGLGGGGGRDTVRTPCAEASAPAPQP